jgi:anaerobic selenocysteine-containing dehydrogenase/Fe-S-cluster-containing dehydrogenase component
VDGTREEDSGGAASTPSLACSVISVPAVVRSVVHSAAMPPRNLPDVGVASAAPVTARTVCPRNCYCTCGMVVTHEGGRITRIEGDPENAATRGRVCLKGISYARRVDSPDRLLHPLKRQPDGSFARASWDEALGEIAARLDGVRRDRGPEAALYYEASGSHGALGRLSMAFWHQFGGCTLTYGDLCWPAGLEATRLTYGANLHSHPRHTASSRFILLWGHNPAETNVHQMRWIHDAQEQGARLAVVDPRGTDTTDAADVHLQPRPGTDAALALGMARVIVHAGLHDREFLERHASGVDRYLDRLRGFTLDRVSTITGLRAASIERLALDYARTRPALLIAGFGLQRHGRAGQTMRAVALLPALTGNLGVPGGGWQYANLHSHCLLDPRLPPEPPRVRRAIPVARLGPALVEIDRPAVSAAWIEKGNPASQNPRSNLVRDGLRRMELVVVVDQFMTDTARLAHFVLPAKTMFEEEDLVTAYWHPYLQRRTKLWEPPGEVKTDTEIWRLLSARFGFDTTYFPAGDDEVHDWLARLLPREGLMEELALRPIDVSGTGDVAFPDLNFPTPSGRVEFASDEATRVWGVDPVPDYTPLEEGHESAAVATYPLQLLSCKTRDRIHSQFGNLDWVRDVERPHRLDIHPTDAAARGLADGDEAEVWNDRGRLAIRVRIDDGLRPGVVHAIEGRCREGDPDINVLVDAGVTDVNHGATFYECLVEVRRRPDARPAAGDPRLVAVSRETAARRARGAPQAGPVAVVRQDSTLSFVTAPQVASREPQAGFVLDLGRCVGCGACVLACRLENGWTAENPWRRVVPLNLARRPSGPTYFLSLACHHCERPACVAACPSRAYERRADGVVVHHESRCIGCRYCEMACPFGAPRYDPARGVMTKCHLCHHRLDAGEAPACTTACPTGALVEARAEPPSRDALRRASPEPGGGGRLALPGGDVPGFEDAAGCAPSIRFVAPRGARRAELYRRLCARLRQDDDGRREPITQR